MPRRPSGLYTPNVAVAEGSLSCPAPPGQRDCSQAALAPVALQLTPLSGPRSTQTPTLPAPVGVRVMKPLPPARAPGAPTVQPAGVSLRLPAASAVQLSLSLGIHETPPQYWACTGMRSGA